MPQDSVGLAASIWNALTPVLAFLRHEPELALFLAIGIGFYVGQKKIGPVQFGGVCGTLLTALVLGQSGVVIDPSVKSLFFAIFIFALGYLGGPQFFSSLNAKGLRLGLFSLIEVGLVLTLALTAMHIFKFDPGTTAGLVAGSATESAVIGTASEAISRLPLNPDILHSMQANVATAYSLTYIFGLITIVVFTSQIAPLLLRRNLEQEATSLWEKLGGNSMTATPGASEALSSLAGRIYSVTVGAGKTVEEVEKLMGQGARIEKVRRRGHVLDVGPFLTLRKGDLAMVMGHRPIVLKAQAVLGEEPLLDAEVEGAELHVGDVGEADGGLRGPRVGADGGAGAPGQDQGDGGHEGEGDADGAVHGIPSFRVGPCAAATRRCGCGVR